MHCIPSITCHCDTCDTSGGNIWHYTLIMPAPQPQQKPHICTSKPHIPLPPLTMTIRLFSIALTVFIDAEADLPDPANGMCGETSIYVGMKLIWLQQVETRTIWVLEQPIELDIFGETLYVVPCTADGIQLVSTCRLGQQDKKGNQIGDCRLHAGNHPCEIQIICRTKCEYVSRFTNAQRIIVYRHDGCCIHKASKLHLDEVLGGALLLVRCASVEPHNPGHDDHLLIPLNGVKAGAQMLFEEQDNHGQELCGHSATGAIQSPRWSRLQWGIIVCLACL